jgi:uncharacterized protein
MDEPEPPIDVRHNESERRFEATVDGLRCSLDYRLDGSTLELVHTDVPPSLEGRGIASALSAAAFRYASENRLRVQPVCSYVRSWVRRHPAQQALLAG